MSAFVHHTVRFAARVGLLLGAVLFNHEVFVVGVVLLVLAYILWILGEVDAES